MAINVNEINAALEQIEVSKGISKERVIEALKESMAKAYRKSLGGDDAMVEVIFDLDTGVIDMYQIKNVVKDVEDDLLEISVEDANEGSKKKYKAGDEYHIHANLDELRKGMVIAIKNLLKQKFAEAEKEVLHEQFKDKINTLITGRVEQFDDRGCSVNIGRTSVYLTRKQMIKDEKFNVGDTIKLFVEDVNSGTKGAHIAVSRSSEGFLKAVMSEEIHDIYDGTITIVSVAREAGERSKVAVTSKDVNVDPAGACIGPNGSRIQKVVSQLGNSASKEKIDIITYKEIPGLYVIEALKPAQVVGVSVDEEAKKAIVVVKDDSLSLAIGRKGVNIRLAKKLTGYEIDIKLESDATNEGLAYQTFDELNALDMEARAIKIAEAQRETLVYQNKDKMPLPGIPEGYVAPQERKYEDESNDFDAALEEEADKEELKAAPVSKEEVKEEVKVEEEKVEEVVPKVKETTAVKTTTTLEDLEKALADDSNKANKKSNYSKRKKKVEEEEKDETTSISHADGPRMSIYTEEELKELEAEENDAEEVEDDDIDYDEYDQYYDED